MFSRNIHQITQCQTEKIRIWALKQSYNAHKASQKEENSEFKTREKVHISYETEDDNEYLVS
jgi:hypothetical protein